MKKKSKAYLLLPVVVLLLSLCHLRDVKMAVNACGDGWMTGSYLLLVVCILVALTVIGYLLFGKRLGEKPCGLEYVWLVAGLSLGILYLFVLAPLSAPDEISHFTSSYQLSSRLMRQPSNDAYGRVLLRAEDAWLEDVEGIFEYEKDADGYFQTIEASTDGHEMLGEVLDQSVYEMIYELGVQGSYLPEALQKEEGAYVSSTYPPVVTTPLAYVPQALGISLGRLAGANTIVLLYLGRFFNLLFFVAMIFWTIRRAPFGKEVFLGVGLLPMTLHLAGSFSYDVMILGCMFLFGAVCLDLTYKKEKVTWKDILLLAILLAVAGPCKIIYAVLMGLCLLIPIKKFGGKGKWLLSAAFVSVVFAVTMYAVNHQVISTYTGGEETYILWADEPGYSLSLVLHQPLRTMGMIYRTICMQFQQWHITMIGGYLGNMDAVLDVPYIVVMAFTGSLLGLAFRKPGETIQLKGYRRAWILLLCAGCALAAMVSMLIAWTPLSAGFIKGVQGRYFLPFLPLLLLAVKNDRVVLTKDTNRSILYFMCCCNGYALLRLFSIVCMRL